MTEGTTTSQDTDASGNNIKRRGSWRKFKETVKETVQGWVGGKGDQAQVNNVPSAVFPSDEVTSATINVKHVLHNTNCYSGGKKPDTSPDLPKILVTCDEPPPPLVLDPPMPMAPERPVRHKQQQQQQQQQLQQIQQQQQQQQQIQQQQHSAPIGVPQQSQPVAIQKVMSSTPPHRGSPVTKATGTPPTAAAAVNSVPIAIVQRLSLIHI